MPHVYIVTVGPGSNGTTSRRAVSYRRTGMRLQVEAGQANGSPRPVAVVHLQQHRGEGLDGRRRREGAGVDRPQARDLGDQLAGGGHGVGMIGADEDVTVELV